MNNSLTRRNFVRGLAAAAGVAAWPAGARSAPGQGAAEEAELRGLDPRRRGTFSLGRVIYRNPLRSAADLADFHLEGQAIATFPAGRLRLENRLDAGLKQKSNFVYWLPPILPDSFAASWEFRALREPGLGMIFFAAQARRGGDIFAPGLASRNGDYTQYHHGDIDALHLSYFRQTKPGERALRVCNLRKSYGFHLVAEGADPLPPVADARPPYAIDLIKRGPTVAFFINRLLILQWTDEGERFGPALRGGRIGLRQMAPLQAEYENFVVREVA